MAHVSLSRRDLNVLEKIKDPESDPSQGVLIDSSLPKDPHVRDPTAYEQVARRERDIILSMQRLEMRLAGVRRPDDTQDIPDVTGAYRTCVSALGDLISEFPDYASARNNRAQALRRLYGDSMLLLLPPPANTRQREQEQEQKQQVQGQGQGQGQGQALLLPDADPADRLAAAHTALSDLDRSVALLTPPTPYAALSPQAAKTLSMAHTQRAALYHRTARSLAPQTAGTDGQSLLAGLDAARREAGWTRLAFEEAASRDFAMGGRYGSEIARALAVGTNPTAKLCGQIVREAMRKEYGAAFAS